MHTWSFEWVGPGWYAGRSIRNHTRYYHCGYDPQREPDTYLMGLGTPTWYDERPADNDDDNDDDNADFERDFWGNPQTVNLWEGNAGDLYMGYTLGPTWHRLSGHITPGGFAKDAALYEDGLLDTWTDELDHSPITFGASLVAEYRDGRTRYTRLAYVESSNPGLAAREYVGDLEEEEA